EPIERHPSQARDIGSHARHLRDSLAVPPLGHVPSQPPGSDIDGASGAGRPQPRILIPKESTMAEPKTKPTDASVPDFLDSAATPRRREEGHSLARIFAEVTGADPVMWGPSIVGYGSF